MEASVLDPETRQTLRERFERLQPGSPRRWGTMGIAQMLAHCSAVLNLALGKRTSNRSRFGLVFGPLLRKAYLSRFRWPRNAPTGKAFRAENPADFASEKAELMEVLTEFAARADADATLHPHPFFGSFSPKEWGVVQYKHLDHHLRQFGG